MHVTEPPGEKKYVLKNFDPPFPLSIVVTLGVLAIGVAVWRELFGKRKLRPGWFHPCCLVLRILAIAALVFVLLNRSQSVSTRQPTRETIILLDASASMSLPGEKGTRWDSALAFAESASEKIESAKIVAFSEKLITDSIPKSPVGRETNLAAALERLLAGSSEQFPESIILVSDGRIHDRGQLGGVLGLASAARIPLSTRSLGVDRPPRNARLSAVHAPRMVRPRSPVAVHVEIAGTGIAPSESLNLKLVDESEKILAQSDFFLPSGSTTAEQILVFESGLRTGRYEVQLSVPGQPAIDLDDNGFSFVVEIATGKLRVLFTEGTHWKRTVGEKGHCWNDMEFMTRAWEATGEIEHLSLTPWSQYLNEPNLAGVTFHNGEMRLDRSRGFPKTREELHAFDVLIVSDVPRGNFSIEQMEWVVDWIENRGGGFLMGGGNTTFDSGKYDKTPWEKIVPVDMRAYGEGNLRQWFEIDIPESVRGHPLWAVSPDPKENQRILDLHPRFTGMNLVRRAKPGALVLATRRGTGEPVIAAQRYGRGRSVAFMPDPNGGGGTFYLDWGPEDSPVMAAKVRHIGLGHGRGFRFNEAVAKADYGPDPGHPSPWYAQYWVNMVRWLGENSIRWQRDKFACRVVDARARPGKKLAVAAEVLTVSDGGELLGLDVGARLEGDSSRRVRLLYDRDRREFTGELSIPAHRGNKTEMNVLFDVEINGQVLSQSVAVGVHRGNPEFSEPAPDPVFLKDLARATGGRVLETADDAAEASKEAARRRQRETQQNRTEPLWPRSFLWIIFAVCFCLEWALRRIGGRSRMEPALSPVPTAVLVVLLGMIGGLVFGDEAGAEKSIEDWIVQLGADRVRLRDEAENFLRETPEAYAPLTTLFKESENEEAKLRAENILRHLRSHRWQLVAVRRGHSDLDKGYIMARGLIVSNNRTRLYSRARDFVREWNLQTLEPLRTFGESSFAIREGWLVSGIARAIAITPDNRKLAATNEYGEIIIYDPKNLGEKIRFSVDEAKPFIEKKEPYLQGIVLSALFLPDRRRLLSGVRWGARLWDSETGKEIWTSEFRQPAFSMALTPDRKKVIICGDPPRASDPLFTVDLKDGKTLSEFELSTRLGGLSFNSAGTKLLGFGRDGFARVYDYDSATGNLSNEQSYGPNSKECQGTVWGPDESTILVTSWNPKQAMTEWDLETGEAIWKAPPMDFGLCTPVWIDKERIAILGAKGILTIWKFTGG